MTTAYHRFTELAERESLGDALTAAERAFVEEYAASDPVAAAELALFASLDASLDAAPTDIADRAFADRAVQKALSDSAAPASPRPIRRGRWLVWGVGSVAAAAAAFAVFVRAPAPTVPVAVGGSVIEYVASQVQVEGQRVEKGAHAAVGSAVVAMGGPACVAVEPRIHACLASGARVRLTAVGSGHGKRRLDLLAGRVAVALDPLPPGERLSVVANGIWSTAVGTAFTVELLADGTVRTIVHEGKVAIGTESGSDFVDSHKIGLSSGSSVRVDPPVVHAPLETPDWIALAQVAGRPIEGPTAEMAAAPTSQTAVNSGAEAEHVPAARAIVSPSHKPVPPQGEAPAAAAVTPASLLAAARQALREQRWADAGTSYRQLVDTFPSTPEAHTVLVSLAKLELDRLGQPSVALRDLNSYLDRGGPLTLEAKLARVKAYRALGRPIDEASAIDDVLASHPSGLEVEQLKTRREELAQ